MWSLKNLKIKQQIYLLTGIAIFSIIAIQLFNYLSVHSLIQNRAKDYSQSSIQQVEESLNTTIKNLEDAADRIAYNRFVQNFLQNDTLLSRIKLNPYLEDLTNNVLDINDELSGVALIEADNSWLNFYGNLDYLIYQKIDKKVDFQSSDFSHPLFETIVFEDKIYYAYLLPIYDINNGLKLNNRLGTAILLAKSNNIRRILNKLSIDQYSTFLVVDKNNFVIASNHRDQEAKALQYCYKKYEKSSDLIVQSTEIESVAWKVYGVTSISEVTDDLNLYQYLIVFTGLIMILFLTGIAVVLNRNITRPIEEIVNMMAGIGEKDIKEINLNIDSELGLIVKNANKMLNKIESLTQAELNANQQIYETEISKKQAELLALQSQINPHFLYNTLECMRSIGMVYNIDEIVIISTAMADIFRYSIKENTFVRVSQELKVIKNYIKIMQLRFPDKLAVDIKIGDDILDQKILKMSLQPIVENAIYHGLEGKNSKGHLIISAKIEKESIIFKIKDDGRGMSKENLALLRSNLNNFFNRNISYFKEYGIGIMNINKRIKLHLGEEYGLEIYSKENKGTEVIITMPIKIDKKRGDNYGELI